LEHGVAAKIAVEPESVEPPKPLFSMNTSEHAALSRREWLERMSGPALVASLGAGMLATMPALAQPAGSATEDRLKGAKIYNVRDFGAKGDGTTIDTVAVQTAIDTCSRELGGTVLVPAGDFVIGTVDLKSHVTLHLATKGRLLGSPRKEDYRPGAGIPRSNGNVVLLGAAGIENLTIEGNGTIDGNGLKFWTGQGDNTGPGQNSAQGYFERPHLIVFSRCQNVRMRDVFLTASAYHCTRILDCERVWFDGVRIFNRVNKNNDGFHFNNCQYVHVTNCDVKCQDDACALFGGNKWVTVSNCTFSTRWSIFRFGGGDAENITITNCVIYDTYGSVIKMAGRAGTRYENITFSNLIMKNVTGPITVGLNSIRRTPAGAPAATTPPVKGVVRNISFNNIRAQVVAEGKQFADMHWEQGYRDGERRTCITLNGVGDEVLENISLTDVHVIYEGGGTAAEAALRDVPQVAGEYFEIGPRPAYGLYVRGVRGLTLNNVRVEVKTPDLRPAVIFDNVSDAAVSGLSAQGNPDAESVLRFIGTRDTLLTATRILTPAAVLLRVEGASSDNIVVDGGDIAKAAKPLEFAAGAPEKSARVRG
jgi:polygalacturonase